MSLSVENLEKNMAKLTIEVSAEEFEDAIKKAYNNQKNKIQVAGFRKGKVPQAYLEKIYGAEMFYEEAANIVIPDAYAKEMENCELDIVSQPKVDVTQMEKGKSFIFTAEVAIKPEVTLGEYKGLEVEKETVDVTEEEVNAELDKAREQNSRTVPVEGRPVQDKDEVTIDFEGFVDEVAFEGGKGTDYQLVIGSHSFIDTFEDQLIGKNVGENVDVNVTFPDPYQSEDLAGKPALFKVVIKAIKAIELPELDDEFASEVSEFDTMAEYKEDVKSKLLDSKQKEADNKREEKIVDSIIENATMEIPDAMVETQQQQMVDEFAQRISQQGLKIEQYFQFTGTTREAFVEQMKPQAMKRIQSRLVLEAVVKAENIQVSEDEFKAEMEKMASMYQMEAEQLLGLVGDSEKKQIENDIAVQKAVDFVVAQAK